MSSFLCKQAHCLYIYLFFLVKSDYIKTSTISSILMSCKFLLLAQIRALGLFSERLHGDRVLAGKSLYPIKHALD